MNTLWLVFLLITGNVVTTAEANKTDVLPEPKNAFKFEEEPDTQSSGIIKFEDQDKFQQYDNLENSFQQYDSPENQYQQFDGIRNTINDSKKIKFEDQDVNPQHYSSNTIEDAQRIKFEDNRVNQKPKHQKKKRRRKPKRLQNAQGSGYVRPVYPAPGYLGTPVYPGYPVYPGPPLFGPGPIYPGQRPYQPGYPPLYKPRPSATSAALSAVTEALTSIASYDDAQCVPRLLCEAAGGGSVPGTGLIQSIAGLQPLLTLLAAYNGISSSPLFVFGRAVFLGMTSKANPGTCRYAYPQCPNDPEQLVHYLNNHNGGFFRFFAAPELNQPQGVEQFYNQLSGNYGLYQPQQQQNLQQYGSQQNYLPQPFQQQSLQQGYGLQQNNQAQYLLHQQNLQQSYQNIHSFGQLHGQYQNQYVPQQSYQNQNLQTGYGLQQPFNQNYHQKRGLYNGYGLYGQSYPYQNNLNQNKIQRRIQNIRSNALVDNVNPKWSFPEESSNKYTYSRFGKVLKFPQNNVNLIKAAQGFTFPGIQSNREYPIDSIEEDINSFDQKLNVFELYTRTQNNYGTVGGTDGFEGSKDNGDGRILYIVRGNGDPNNPEIVRLAPGQSL